MGYKTWKLLRKRHTDKLPHRVYLEGQLSDDLQLNMRSLEEAFAYPENFSLKVRHIFIRAIQLDAAILYIESAADAKTVEENIIKPLLEADIRATNEQPVDNIDFIKQYLLPALSVKVTDEFHDINEELLHGNAVLLISSTAQAIIAETQGFESRGVSTPQIEQALRGPKEAFIESAETNRSLIRKYVRDNDLHCDVVKFGKNNSKTLYLMYMRNIANEQIVERVRKQIELVESDTVQNLYIMEQLVEERPYSLIPSVILTERPDRVAGFLQEGHVAAVMENSPVAMVAPVTFWSLFHAAEDQYQRWVSGNFIRFIRLVAILVTMLIPAVYVAISTYHVEMLPTDLMLAIAAARERVPFPVIAEILFMELTFELIRESGVRVPAPIGTTIGIVGALVLGQAAVDANLVSPILVIIVAITGLASFIIPDIALNFSIRVQRFIFILFGAAYGFFGLALYMTFMIAYLVSFKSFGVPFFSPMAPHVSSSKDMFFRPPTTRQWMRPANLSPKDPVKQDKPEGN